MGKKRTGTAPRLLSRRGLCFTKGFTVKLPEQKKYVNPSERLGDRICGEGKPVVMWVDVILF